MSGREATNVRPRGHECPVERPRMSGREATNVQLRSHECPVQRRETSPGLAPGRGPTKLGRMPLGRCARYARSTGHSCPLDGAFLPARPDIRARSTGHSCPLDPTYVPARPDIRGRSRRRTRPLDGAGVDGPVAYLTLTVATLEVCPLLRSIMRTRLAPRCASSTKLWNRPEPLVTAGKGNVIHRPCLRS
ncbi:MAG: hypothetical protein QOD35_2184 [Nocardioidaceae bacterium]|nr:hypothetical protein [Nocardioidaceae bacterium]